MAFDKVTFRAGIFIRRAAEAIEARGVALACSASDTFGRCAANGRTCIPCALRHARDAYDRECAGTIPAADLTEALTAAIEAVEKHRITADGDAPFALYQLGARTQDASVLPTDR